MDLKTTKVLLLFFAIIVVTVGVFIYQQFYSGTASWEVYRNGPYNYSLKFPKGWFFREFCVGELDEDGDCIDQKPGFSLTKKDNPENIDTILNDDDINVYVFDKINSDKPVERFVARRNIDKDDMESVKNKEGLEYLFYKNTEEYLQLALFESEDYFIFLELINLDIEEKADVYSKMINTISFLD